MDTQEIRTGYKATDKNMQCRGFQFELGVWHKHDGELSMCESGFHFCEYPSGPWYFYSSAGTRIFRVEAKNCILGDGPGSDLKHVAMEIRLVEEIIFTGHWNTGDRNAGDRNAGNGNAGNGNTGGRNAGDWNTGHWNTGDRNAGDRNAGNGNTGGRNAGDWNTGYGNTGDGNTGDGNTGYRNTGYRNTGNRNTGDRNTGDRNTGNGNTGDRNTGNRNTGYGNTGYGNTGYRNTGNRNTGDGNATDKCSGYLCLKKQDVIVFDQKVKPGIEVDYYLIAQLSEQLMSDDDFNIDPFLSIPNATKSKIKILHQAHIARRNNK